MGRLDCLVQRVILLYVRPIGAVGACFIIMDYNASSLTDVLCIRAQAVFLSWNLDTAF